MDYEISMLFPEGKRKALTFSYDDGTIHDRRLAALLNEYGMKGTFNLNYGLLGKLIFPGWKQKRCVVFIRGMRSHPMPTVMRP